MSRPVTARLSSGTPTHLMIRALLVLAILAVPSMSEPRFDFPPPPAVGFSFSPKVATAEQIDPQVALRTLLTRLHPNLVRLPVYWDQAEAKAGQLDFSLSDALIDNIQEYNAEGAVPPVRVVLVVGARNLGNPELHLPEWVGRASLSHLARSAAYEKYLEAAFAHFSANPLLAAWQIENEPLDNTNPWLGDVALPVDMLRSEIDRLRRIDPGRPVVMTTFDSATVSLDQEATSRFNWLWNLLPVPHATGHPQLALQLGDVLGLDAYVVTPKTSLSEVNAQERIAWKRGALNYWSQQATQVGKRLWITEMQAAPWDGLSGFTRQDLLESAAGYRTTGASAVLFWGVESWLTSPQWMAAGVEAMELARGTPVLGPEGQIAT
jgi:hypothetical protein